MIDVATTFQGKRILFAGATGFVGKVALSMLLERFPGIAGVHVLVRPGSAGNATDRFFQKIAPSEPFQPLRDRLGDAGARKFFEEKCSILSGDVTDPLWGLTPEQAEALVGKIDAVINCAGLVSFDPSLEIGIDVNVVGVQNAIELCLKVGAPLVHVSTCFVRGARAGQVFENEPVPGYFPKLEELDGREFDVDSEVADCRRLIAQTRERADDKRLAAGFRTLAIERLRSEGRDPEDEKAMRLALGRERKLWLAQELTRVGMDRAQSWGWTNTYTYTKSLGEQAMAKAEARGLRWTTVRPSIVESALRYPFPGWNEGFTTSAPLTFLAMKGHRQWPNRHEVILDIIPVDLVAAGLLAITAAAMNKQQERVYQLASGDTNPLIAPRVVELTGIYRRRYYRNKETGSAVTNFIKTHLEPQVVSMGQYQKISAPLFLGAARAARDLIDTYRPKWGAPRFSAALDKARDQLDELEDQVTTVDKLIQLFAPFIWENRYLFRCDHIRSLYQQLSPESVALLPWDPHQFEWRDYWMNVHMPGMEKWVYPGLEEETSRKVHVVKAHRDLLELFEASVEAHGPRTAFRMFEGEARERFSYRDAREYAIRVGRFLVAQGVKKGDRVMLLGENRPEWPISFFGILKAGATAVPVDVSLTEAELINLARSSRAALVLISEERAEELPGLGRALELAGLATRVHTFPEALAGGPHCKLLKTANPDDVASLIFTSGTTGTPKAVMLTHRNFASLVAKLAGVFDLRSGDGVLSVLPLHHTFEFSCGLLLPFSRGSEITYLDELTADRLGDALESNNVTAMIGVPALWQLLHRRITQEVAAQPAAVEQSVHGLMSANAWLRNRLDFNLGKLLFWPVHRKLGGRLRYLVSGGSALAPEVQEAFHAMGFNIAEGYGLTESAPVLTVTPVQNKRIPGSVGRALSGVEIKLHEVDAEGIGEVIAKGPNVMPGYFENREATDAVLKDGWLHTGDLGRLDAEGNLFLVGRKKDVILDASGKNVYPDELEELYQKHDRIKELSIVGLPEEGGVGERVACLCVPDYREEPREAVRRELEQHFRDIGAAMPFYRRVKVLHFWDGTLPRTATRKVKRKLVIEELKKLERIASSAKSSRETAASREKGDGWLYDLLAEVSQKGKGTLTAETRLASDLGFDSLMLTELQVGLESAGVALAHVENLAELQTVGELAKLVRSAKRTGEAAPARHPEEAEAKRTEFEVPAAVARIGRRLLEAGQRVLYESAFDVSIHGQNYIPRTRNFLVVANHSSHLDMGLVKIALGEEGERLTALAARDYFFDTPLKRAYFENFTSLIPMDRHGSLKQSLRLAGEAIESGYHLLIFPEGTRSKDGKLAEFKPTTGYLALKHDVDILPMYIEGAYEALPKGAILPKARELTVRIGPSLRIDQFRSQIAGVAKSEAYRVITRAVEESVRALSEGRVVPGAKRVVKRAAIPAPVNGTAEHGPTNGKAEAAPAKAKPASKPAKRKEKAQ